MFGGSHDRANGRKQVVPPIGTKPVSDFLEDCAHPSDALVRVIRGRNVDILQKNEQVVLDVGMGFPQPSVIGVGCLER
jgi:hypothetical protein